MAKSRFISLPSRLPWPDRKSAARL